MMKVMCGAPSKLPIKIPDDEHVFSYFRSAQRNGVGTIANRWHGGLRTKGFSPSPAIWDFVQFCLAVCAADQVCLRKDTADGWTRTIQLTVGLCEPLLWNPLKSQLEEMLKVLTGDYWTLIFNDSGMAPPRGVSEPLENDCVSLLSGGLDSLIGGLDLVAQGHKPIFVSQLAHKDSERQRKYAKMLSPDSNHFQWSHGIHFKGKREPSTRARSMAFYAFAVLASSRLKTPKTTIYVPENGLICINPPLLPGRVSSLSTKTTHPLFLSMLQHVLTERGIEVELVLPYRFKSKGEMMNECLDQVRLSQYASDSTSCGRFQTYKNTHCGRCIPCLIRRSAFEAWNHGVDKTRYFYSSVVGSDKTSDPDDPMALAQAVLDVRQKGIDRFLKGALGFSSLEDRPHYRRVIEQGLKDLEQVLIKDQLLAIPLATD